MSEKIIPGPVQDGVGIREAVCIHTKKIFDSCRDKDCIEGLRFYPTQGSQNVIDRALSVRAGKAELLYVHTDVEPAGFNRGFYSVDIRYYYRITAEAFVGAARPVEVTGLAVFDKRVILFGSEGNAKIFTSQTCFDDLDDCAIRRSNLPIAVVEAVDPIVLSIKLVDICDCHPCKPDCHPCKPNCNPCDCNPCDCNPCDCNPCDCRPDYCDCTSPCYDCELTEIPPCIASCFGCDLNFGSDRKRICLTLGQFSIIRLERDTQLLIPVYDYCMPQKECTGSGGNSDNDPCEIFRQVRFPVDEFFPPNAANCHEDYHELKSSCNCCN